MNKIPIEMTLNERKIDLTLSLFVTSGDYDYISARWSYSHAMSQQFFWHAAQTLEKHLKALLLLNDTPIKSYSHKLPKLWAKAKSIDKLKMLPNKFLTKDIDVIGNDYWDGKPISEFIEFISYYGSPHSRYGNHGTELYGPLVFMFDSVIASIRCTAKKQNILSNDLFKYSQNEADRNGKILNEKDWMLHCDLILERLYDKKYHVGQKELRSIFLRANGAFMDGDNEKTDGIFGGMISMGSPILNHLVRFRNPERFLGAGYENSDQNNQTIERLEQWVETSFGVSKEMWRQINNPRNR